MSRMLQTEDGATRREVIVAGAAAGGALLVGCSPAEMLPNIMSLGADTPVGPFGPFIKVGADGAVTVLCKHIEFGQ
ncbi:MAG TPA: twin-arginine translocation signal domain-containing protein, partial [Phenylobacterium sp.]|nr:twin-arginine translocation signal domain-containing protein [Phenylobacterium sp.]